MISVFFDLDGVLADFVRGALAVHGRTDVPFTEVPWGIENKIGLTQQEFWAPMGFDFWANLQTYDDGFLLLRQVENLVPKEQIALLTSPCDTPGCIDGKRMWIKQHLPEYASRTFFGRAKELFAGPSKILIDDHEHNTNKWRDNGGLSILIPRPWNWCTHMTTRTGEFKVPSVLELVKTAVIQARAVRP